MSAIMKSVTPNICEKVANGECTILVGKTCPKLKTPFKGYIYCANGEGLGDVLMTADRCHVLNGKVIGEFVCDRIDKYECYNELPYDKYNLPKSVLKSMCLICHDVDKYGAGKPLFGWHISDLKIYDKPKELNEFRKSCNHVDDCCTCKRALYEHKNNSFYSEVKFAGCDNEITRPPTNIIYVDEITI